MEKFNTAFSGYNKEEVNKFIDDVIKQVETMINNMKSKDLEIERLKAELEHYKNLEDTFNRALIIVPFPAPLGPLITIKFPCLLDFIILLIRISPFNFNLFYHWITK